MNERQLIALMSAILFAGGGFSREDAVQEAKNLLEETKKTTI